MMKRQIGMFCAMVGLWTLSGCVNVTATCECTGGNPNVVEGSKCGGLFDVVIVTAASTLDAAANCLLARGSLGVCTYENEVLASCPAPRGSDQPIPDAAFAE